MLRVALPRDLRHPLQQSFGLFHDQLGNHFVVQAPEQIAIAGEVAAIEQRYSELRVIGIIALAFGERAGSWTELQTKVPELLRQAADRIFEALLRLTVSEKEQDIDVREREKPPTPEASSGNERHVCGLRLIAGDDVAP